MKRQSIYFTFFIIVLAVISVSFFIIKEPEYIQIVSDDHTLIIEGDVREAQDIQIDLSGDYLYEVGQFDSSFIKPLKFTFNVSQAQFDFDIAVYKYNDEILMWEAISSAVDSTAQEIVVMQNSLGVYAIKEYIEIEVPDFINTYDDILLMAPDSTVGYEIALGFIAIDGSIIRLSEKTELGGCAGIVEHGEYAEMSQLEREARVYIEDVEQKVEFLIVAQWFINEESGCEDVKYLKPSQGL